MGLPSGQPSEAEEEVGVAGGGAVGGGGAMTIGAGGGGGGATVTVAGGGGGGATGALFETVSGLLFATSVYPLLSRYRNSYVCPIRVFGAVKIMVPLAPLGTYFHAMVEFPELGSPTRKRPIQSVVR